MTMQTEATYENGILRPFAPLPLPEHARVTLTIQAAEDSDRARDVPPADASDWIQRVRAWVASAPKVSHIADDSRESIYE
jgi:predicted DNA-binding antitoxin AbrB/MazE fold protein